MWHFPTSVTHCRLIITPIADVKNLMLGLSNPPFSLLYSHPRRKLIPLFFKLNAWNKNVSHRLKRQCPLSPAPVRRRRARRSRRMCDVCWWYVSGTSWTCFHRHWDQIFIDTDSNVRMLNVYFIETIDEMTTVSHRVMMDPSSALKSSSARHTPAHTLCFFLLLSRSAIHIRLDYPPQDV